MIFDARYWQGEIGRLAKLLRRHSQQRRWTAASDASVEKCVMLGFYAIRKMLHSAHPPAHLKPPPKLHVTVFPRAVAAISFAAEDIHKWRRKVLAHADLSTATDASPPPIPEVSREQFEALTNKMVSVLQDVEQHYCGSSTNYDGECAKRASIELLGALRRTRL